MEHDRDDLVLALDSSTPWISAAVVRIHPGDGAKRTILADACIEAAGAGSTRLPRLFDDLLESAGLRLDQVTRLAVGVGPGQFTGIRLALSTMQAIGFARGLPVCGAQSLEALAVEHLGRTVDGGLTRPVCATVDARRGEVYAALYRIRDGGRLPEVEELAGPEALTPAQVADRLAARGLDPSQVEFCGSGVPVLRAAGAIPTNGAGSIVGPRAADIAWLAVARARAQSAPAQASPWHLEPFYLRPPEAEVARQRRLATGT